MSVKKLSRYDLVAVVGQGKLGPIWDGYDPDIRRKVTIKVAPVDQLSDAAAEAMAARFRAEARVAGKLTHPNIVGVYDAGVESGLAYIVTETVTGTTLDALMRQPAGVAPEAMGRTMLQLLSALDYAHGRGVFHLGLQPSLLTITAAGSVKVSDFGAVAAAEPDDSTRAQGSLSEHIRFLAPEQVLGLEADARADLWAVGVMLFRLWTGQWPFQADSDFGLIQQIIKQPFALPSALNSERGEEHDQLIGRALAKSAGDRYPNAREFAADLSRIMARTAAGVPAGAPSPRRASETAPLDKPTLANAPAAIVPAPPAVAAPAAAAAPSPAAEDELGWWRRIQLSDRAADFEAFLAVHPKGVCADLARTRLRRLAGATDAPAPAPAAVAPRPDADDETRMSPVFVPKSIAPPAPVPAPPPAPAPAPQPAAAPPAGAAPAQPAPRAAPAAKAPSAQGANAPAGKPWLPVVAGVVLIGAAAAWWLLRGGAPSGDASPAVAASAPAVPASAAVAEAPAPSAPQASASAAASAPVTVAAEPPAPPAPGPAVAPSAALATAAATTAIAAATAPSAPKPAVATAASAATKPLTPREQAAARKAAADLAAKAKAAAAQASATPAPAPRPVEEERPRPAPVAEAPKPVEAPASVAAGPTQPCGGRVFIARLSCMKDACQQAQWASHPQCVEFKRLEETNRGRRGENQ